MNDFRPLAHLEEQLGVTRWRALIDPANTGKIKDILDGLVAAALPATMTLGDRTYDILGFLKGDETSVVGHTMVERATEMGVNLGQEDGEYLLAHQSGIPTELRGKVTFVFTAWRRPVSPESVACVYWGGGRWVQGWIWLGHDFFGGCRVLRRK